MDRQLRLLEVPTGDDWRIDQQTKDVGRRGVAEARRALAEARKRVAA